MKALIGYTGFVGSNIYASAGNEIDAVYNSKNISQAYGTEPELLIYAGLRAEKYLANHEPEKDRELIIQAEENIEKINPKNVVLISTVDVFKDPEGADENTEPDTLNLPAYGLHRYQLELWVRERYQDALVIRLPGLFGKNIKKNFIYDFINVIPSMLNAAKFRELSGREPQLEKYYRQLDNGFYQADVPDGEREKVKGIFQTLGFSALHFTDSRSRYQFYNLARLWEDMQTVMDAGITLWHPAVEPVCAAEVYRYLTGAEFRNELGGTPASYDYRTIHSALFHGKDGYICEKEAVLRGIKEFVEANVQ